MSVWRMPGRCARCGGRVWLYCAPYRWVHETECVR